MIEKNIFIFLNYTYLCIMNKTKYHFFVFFILFFFLSCEKDDICLQPTTPKLVLTFNDAANPNEIKQLNNLTLIALPIQDTIIYNDIDILKIPLNVNSDNCSFEMIKSGNSDLIQFSYQREDVFVSKTCGYKTVFHNLQITVLPDSNNWINSVEILNSEITIDTTTHVKILH